MRVRKPKTPNGLILEQPRELCPFKIPRSDKKKGILTLADYEPIDVMPEMRSYGLDDHSAQCIETDNPWAYRDLNMNGFEQVKKYRLHPRYPTLSLPALWLMVASINRLAAPKCHLWAWTTKDMLPFTFTLYESWGWLYKQCHTWVKTYENGDPVCGGGYWGRNSCEYLLFFVNTSRGNRPLNATKERNVFFAPVPDNEHSAKPDCAYERIARNSPGPRVSLFQRTHREGFIPWGNQAPEVPRAGLVSADGSPL